MFAEERKHRITILVREKKHVTVEELCEAFNVSPATVRKDLNELDEKGMLRRTHGGAMAKNQVNSEDNTEEKHAKCLEEKKSIAREALKFIHEGDCIALDSGTTTYELAKLLGSFSKLKVVTNDLMIAAYLDQNTDVSLFVTGGNVRKGHHYMLSYINDEFLKNICVDTFFISANGVDLAHGLTTPMVETSITKRIIMANSQNKILITDSSKFGKICFSRFADIAELNRLITDEYAKGELLTQIERLGIIVNVVKSISNEGHSDK